jgi:cytochrome c oxidase subunit 1
MGFERMNEMATAGALLLGASVLLPLANMLWSLTKGKPAGHDPWDARTLEWTVPSPPPPYNFARLPQVAHRDDLWEAKRAGKAAYQGEATGIHMPSPSIWPVVAGFGISLALAGLIFNIWITVAGVAIMFVGVYSWALEPPSR